MSCPGVYEKTVAVNSRDVDGCGHCRASALLAYLQDASAEHTVLCGCDRREMLAGYHVFWMLARVWVRLDRPVRWLETLTIRTWHRGGKGVFVYRDFDLLINGEVIGEAVALWVLPDVETRKLLNTRYTAIPGLIDSANGLPPKEKTLAALRAPGAPVATAQREMRYSDTDVNGHVNNTKYADFCCDMLRMDQREPGVFWSELEITYHAECVPGEQLTLGLSEVDGMYFIHGEIGGKEAKFDAKLRLSDWEILC